MKPRGPRQVTRIMNNEGSIYAMTSMQINRVYLIIHSDVISTMQISHEYSILMKKFEEVDTDAYLCGMSCKNYIWNTIIANSSNVNAS